MNASVLTDLATFFKDTGPYGVIVVLGLAIWKLWLAKEKQGEDFLRMMVEIAKENTDALRTAAERITNLERDRR